MNTLDLLYNAVVDDLADNTRRLAYADALMERGDDDDEMRAHFIQLQCKLYDVARGDATADNVAAMKSLEEVMLYGTHHDWLKLPCPDCGGRTKPRNPLMDSCHRCEGTGNLLNRFRPTFERGFMDGVEGSSHQVYELREIACALCGRNDSDPARLRTITDRCRYCGRWGVTPRYEPTQNIKEILARKRTITKIHLLNHSPKFGPIARPGMRHGHFWYWRSVNPMIPVGRARHHVEGPAFALMVEMGGVIDNASGHRLLYTSQEEAVAAFADSMFYWVKETPRA